MKACLQYVLDMTAATEPAKYTCFICCGQINLLMMQILAEALYIQVVSFSSDARSDDLHAHAWWSVI